MTENPTTSSTINPVARILSLDVGSRKIGLALSSLDQGLIFPLGIIRMARFNGRLFFKLLRDELSDYWDEIGMVLIGDGRDTGSGNPVVRYVDQVRRMLSSWTSWDVVLTPEICSSVDGRLLLSRLNYGRSSSLSRVDSYAALLFLYDFLLQRGVGVMVSV